MSSKVWLTTSEAAEYLGTTEGGIRNRVYRKQLKAYKFYERNLFKREELDRLIESSQRRFKKWR